MPERHFAFAADSGFVQVRNLRIEMQSLQHMSTKRRGLCQNMQNDCLGKRHPPNPWANFVAANVLRCNMKVDSTLAARGRDRAAVTH
jgi:hypothetical protein